MYPSPFVCLFDTVVLLFVAFGIALQAHFACLCISKETCCESGEAVLMSFLAQIFRLDWTASI